MNEERTSESEEHKTLLNFDLILYVAVLFICLFLSNSGSGNIDCPRRCAFINCDDSLHHFSCSGSHSSTNQNSGGRLCPSGCSRSFYQYASVSVKVITPFALLLAVLTSSLLASSVFSENVVRLKSSIINAMNDSVRGPISGIQGVLPGDLGVVILSVVLLHFAGFFVGYLAAAIDGFRERQRRAISIEVGMQNSSLGVVLATSHFTSPLIALPPALSAVLMNIMGSTLGFIWRYIDPSDKKDASRSDAV